MNHLAGSQAGSQARGFEFPSPEPEGEEGYGPPPLEDAAFPHPFNDIGRVSPADSAGRSSNTLRFQSNVHKYFPRLKKAMAVIQQGYDGQGSKLIALNLKELQQQRKDLDGACNDEECQWEFSEEIREEIKETLEHLPHLERAAAAAQDQIEATERFQQVKLQQRPCTKFHEFQGYLDVMTSARKSSVTVRAEKPAHNRL